MTSKTHQEDPDRNRSHRAQRLQIVLGGILGVGIAAAVLLAVLASTGGPSGSGSRAATPSPSLPKPKIMDEQAAADAADCELSQPENEGNDHDEREFAAADYAANPPTSGAHFPAWAEDGIYPAGETPPLGELVHTLEHGRVNIQYRTGSGPELIRKLEAMVSETDGYHLLLYENTTEMEAEVAATAWDNQLTCPAAGPKLWDALRTFRDAHVDRGPETVP